MWMLFALAAALIPAVLFWPRKGYGEFRRTIVIDAPIETVWDQISHGPKADGAPRRGWRYEATDEPDVFEGRSSNENAHTTLIRHFPVTEPYLDVTRLEATHIPLINKTTLFPVGEDALEVAQLTPLEDGRTRLFHYSRMRGNLFALLHFRWFALPAYLHSVRDTAQGRPSRPSLLTPGWIWKVAATALALFVSIQQFGWLEGLILAGIIILHEFGHALGYRAVGERVLGIHLVPFFGGVTIGTMPKTAMKSAIVALSGTSFSLVIALILGIGLKVSGIATEIWTADGIYEPNAAGGLALAIGGMLALNILQLLPVGFMDGGRTLDAAVSGLPSPARRLVLAASGLAAAAMLYGFGMQVFAIMAVLFVATGVIIDALSKNGASVPFRPSTIRSGMTIAGLYLGHIGLYVVAIMWLSVAFFLPPGASESDLAELIRQSAGGREQILSFRD